MATKIVRENIIYSGISSGAIPNIVDTTMPGMSHVSIGSYLYRSLNDSGAGHAFTDHIRSMIEANAGAHYYCRSAYSATYTQASFSFKPSEAIISPQGKRRGFAAVTPVIGGTLMGQCDICLANDSGSADEWFPFCWSEKRGTKTGNEPNYDKTKNVYFGGSKGSQKYFIDKNKTVYVRVSIQSTTTNDFVRGDFSYTSDFSSPFAYIEFKGNRGDFFGFHWSTKEPLARFVRFMSLVQIGDETLDNKDNSTMKAYMRNLKLGSSPWPNTREGIQYAWSAQGANILDLQIGGLTSGAVAPDADFISIHHRYQLH